MNKSVQKWFERAESSYRLGIIEKTEGIYYEDLCFQLQQACEKALKVVLIHNDIEPKKTHSFRIILQQIEEILEVPDNIKEVILLENYAVQTRYPGDYEPVDFKEYNEVKIISKNVIDWVKKLITR